MKHERSAQSIEEIIEAKLQFEKASKPYYDRLSYLISLKVPNYRIRRTESPLIMLDQVFEEIPEKQTSEEIELMSIIDGLGNKYLKGI
jgi:hypothetical protein